MSASAIPRAADAALPIRRTRAQETVARPSDETPAGTFAARIGDRTLDVTVIRELQDLAATRETWTGLLAGSDASSAFVSWEWMYSWAERFVRGPRRLCVLVISDAGRPIGIAPWHVDRVTRGPLHVRQLGFLGLPEAGSDYLDVIAMRGQEQAVAEALLVSLFRSLPGEWDVLALDEVPAESRFLARFIGHLRATGKHYSLGAGSFCPVVRLSGTVDGYLSQLSAHARQAYRRKLRALLSNQDVRHVILKGADVRTGLVAFRELYERRWGRSSATDDLFELLDSYRGRAGESWSVELSLLTAHDRAIAGLVHLVRDRTMYQYLMAVDRSFSPRLSIGSLICGLNIDAAIRAGYAEYDFLKAEEDYKFRLTNSGRRSLNLRVHNRTLRSLATWGAQRVSELAKMVLR